jgi:sugar lactone lactonase YvrE
VVLKIQQILPLSVLLVVAWVPVVAAPQEPAEESAPVFYPPAPNLPRLQYLTKFSSAYDVGSRKSALRDFVFGGEENEEQAIGKPYGVAVHEGAIFAVDTRGSGYVVFDVANSEWRSVTGSGNGAMTKPINISIDDDGTRYITDTQRKAIVVFDSNDRFLRVLGSPDQFMPSDVAIAGNRLYVADVENHKVHVLDKTSGETLFAFGEAGAEEGKMAHPTNLAIGPDGNVYVSETSNFRIQVFTPDGEFIRKIGSVGTSWGQFARPKGVAVDREGILYAVDGAFQNVQMFDADGQILMYFGSPGNDRGSLNLPTGIDIDYDNVEYFRKYADPDFEIEYLVVVANQFGPNKIVVYGFGSLKD